MNVPLLVALAALAPSQEAPEWSISEVKQYLAQAQAAATFATSEEKDRALVVLAGGAYRLAAIGNEPVEDYARRILKKREPAHPSVKKGQWLLALTRQLYADLSVRCDRVARFERDRRDREYLERMAQETGAAASAMAQQIQVIIEGLEGFHEPLPMVGGDDPQSVGAMVMIRSGVITIENLDRVRFQNDRPPEGVARTSRGALKEVFSALHQYNMGQKLLAPYEAAAGRNHGHVRVVIAAQSPALYLNEIARAAREAATESMHLMTLSKTGELKELLVPVGKPAPTKKKKKSKKKAAADVEVRCDDAETMELCARRINHARTQGAPYYQVD